MRLALYIPVLLLATLAYPAVADPGVRDAVRMSQLQTSGQGQPERRSPEFVLPEPGVYGHLGQQDGGQGNDAARRAGRLSPEERRALRRQIDEAGHDLYQGQR